MENDSSGTLPPQGEGVRRVRCKAINREQLVLRPVDVEKLVRSDHPVRAIWELVGRVNLESFYAEARAFEGEAGAPLWDPRLLISVWIYAYKEGVSAAREISRLCEYHPAYQWLTGMEVINYHTLADFRVLYKEALDELFIEVLGVLSHEGLLTLERVMHDGTKVAASASSKSFHRKATLEDHLRLAREQVEQMGDPHSEELAPRVAAARERALREKQRRLEEAIGVLENMHTTRSRASGKKEKMRASSTDPDARVMKGAKGAYGPSYNVQISTDATAKIIVGVGVTQTPRDADQLEPAIRRIEATMGKKPTQIVVDAGLVTQDSLKAMAEKEVNVIGALPALGGMTEKRMRSRGVTRGFYSEAFSYDASGDFYRCPAGKRLEYGGQERRSGRCRYRAKASDCNSCVFHSQCCPHTKTGRSLVRNETTAEMAAFLAKMDTAEAKAIYRQRAGVAEFPNAWIKDKMGVRQFRLRGLGKVTTEATWACLAYNICQWIRLCWKPRRLVGA
jgi:transposase